MKARAKVHVPLFRMGDINGLVYVFVGNIGSILLVITTLKGFGWGNDLIFHKVIPGICAGLFFSGFIYSWMAGRLAEKEGRSDVTALPFGLSTPVTMVYLFSVLMPLQFGLGLSPEETWQAGVAACFLGGIIEAVGGIIGPYVRKWVPRAAMLATVGGISLMWMGTKGLFSVYDLPLIGLPVLLVALLGLIGGYALPRKIPPLLVAIFFGVVLSFIFKKSGITAESLGYIGKPVFPVPRIDALLAGFKRLLPVLAAIVPVEIYNFLDTMNNVESAIAAGDAYNVRATQFADGIATCIGALFGAVLPNTVWIGHPGLKRAGSGIGYDWVSGILFALCGWFGIFQFLNDLIPFVVVAIVFLWCAQVIVAQSFVDCPRRYSVAVIVALVPHVADLLYTQTTAIFNALGAEMSVENLANAVSNGAMWYGVEALKNGAIITGMIWASIICFIIDRNLVKAAIGCLMGAIFTFFGVIHVGQLGVHTDPASLSLAGGYLLAALVVLIFHASRKHLIYDRRYDSV